MQKLSIVIAKIDPNVIQEKVQGADDWKLYILFVVMFILFLFGIREYFVTLRFKKLSKQGQEIELDEFERKISGGIHL
jgi:hypothetical protein